jgi:hypothetical protein
VLRAQSLLPATKLGFGRSALEERQLLSHGHRMQKLAAVAGAFQRASGISLARRRSR